jgi:hypothetical protein
MSTGIVVSYFTTWVISFTAPYLYYDAGLGPMVGFVYAGTTCLSMLWTWYCVGETAGRSNLEVSLFFTEKIPVRPWRKHVFPDETLNELRMSQEDKTESHGNAEHEEFKV